MLKNIVLILVIVLIIGSAVLYIHMEKKRGVKCIGCPEGCSCSGKCGSCGGCGSNAEAK